MPIGMLLACVICAEYYNYVTCGALPLRQDWAPHARWHDFRDEADWRFHLAPSPAGTIRPLTPAEFAQMTYELKRGPMGGELGHAVMGSILAVLPATFLGLPSAPLLLWRIKNRWRWIALLCLVVYISCAVIIYNHGYFDAAFD